MNALRSLVYWVAVRPAAAAAIFERWRRGRGKTEFSGLNFAFAFWPGVLGNWNRREYYRRTLQRCGKNVQFKFGSFCQYYGVELGDNVTFGYFNAIGEVQTGNDVIVGGFVNFLSGLKQHGHSRGQIPFWKQAGVGRKRIVIGNNVWIGSNACVAADVGSSVVVAAGSVVICRVDDYVIVGGNPARKIGDIE